MFLQYLTRQEFLLRPRQPFQFIDYFIQAEMLRVTQWTAAERRETGSQNHSVVRVLSESTTFSSTQRAASFTIRRTSRCARSSSFNRNRGSRCKSDGIFGPSAPSGSPCNPRRHCASNSFGVCVLPSYL